MRINALLDAGFRRHDEFKAAAAIFNKLLMVTNSRNSVKTKILPPSAFRLE
jgi:hypothetical protein